MELKPEWVYELDSSHSDKFSRHLIIRIPGMAFVNNLAVGHLVSQILAEPEVWSKALNAVMSKGMSVGLGRGRGSDLGLALGDRGQAKQVRRGRAAEGGGLDLGWG